MGLVGRDRGAEQDGSCVRCGSTLEITPYGSGGGWENRGLPKAALCPVPALLTAVVVSITPQVQYGLTDEVHQLEGSIRALKMKLAEAQ